MITPRQTRLLEVAGPRGLQRAVARMACHGDPWLVRRTAVIVPSRAAAAQLRRTLETTVLALGAPPSAPRRPTPAVLVLPELLTRDDWYARLHEELPGALPRATPLERDVIADAAAHDAIHAGFAPPFPLRPGLVHELLAFYDALARQRRSIEAFERLITEDLESRLDIDRGAVRLLEQTRFLAAAFRRYDQRLAAAGLGDEHVLRRALLESPAPGPFRHVVVTLADRAADRQGLWPADFDVLTRLAGLEQVDVVATRAALASGLDERLRDMLPGIEEVDEEPAETADGVGELRPAPIVLRSPPEDSQLWWVSRDREDEMSAVAARIASRHRLIGDGDASGSANTLPVPPERVAVVFRRPLPYIYLATTVLSDVGLPFEAFDALPLAAEPYAAALDLVFAFVESRFTRVAAARLMQSPHFRFAVDGKVIGALAVAAFTRAAREAGPGARAEAVEQHLGRADERPASQRQGDRAAALLAARAAIAAQQMLRPLVDERPASEQIATLLAFLDAYERLPDFAQPTRERHLRARAAIRAALEDLRSAHRRHDDRPCRIGELAARIRRWIESRTFSPRTGSSGVHLVDAHAARFGDFDEVHLVGLVEGEWPERPARNIFYPSSLLTQLGWPAEAARMAGERALLADLLRLPRASLSLSSFTLEDDALVEPSTLLEDVQPAAFDVRRDVLEAGAGTPGDIDTVARPAAEPRESADTIWRTLRVSRTSPADPRFHGTTAPAPLRRYAVRAVEDYLDCPFKFFAAHVLGLDGEPGSEEGLDPKARGLLLHGVLQAFYSEWQQSGRGAMTTGDLEEARRLFALVVERHLQALPPSEARLERGRLLGSAVAAGVGDIVFRAEAARETPVVERALEYRLEGSCAIEGGGRARRVELRGVADRIDLLEDGTLRLIDYKLGKAPSRGRAIQLPIYALHAEQQLDGHAGRRWTISEAAYLAFGERDPYVALIDRPADRTAVLADGQARLLDAVEGIEAGQFPPRPAEAYLCARCPFSAVCRKDYVDAD